jgi:hypothetical protein
MENGARGQDVNADYYRQLEVLTAETWLRGVNEESEEKDRE